MTVEAIAIAVLASLSVGLLGVFAGHIMAATRGRGQEVADLRSSLERLEGGMQAEQQATAMQQQVNISLPTAPDSAASGPEQSGILPSADEILERLTNMEDRLHELQLDAAGFRPAVGSFHGYEFGGQFMSQLHWFARWYETFTVDAGLLLIEVVEADNKLKLETTVQGEPLGVLPSRAHAVDEALQKGLLQLDVTSEGAILALTEKGKQLLECWRSWGSDTQGEMETGE